MGSPERAGALEHALAYEHPLDFLGKQIIISDPRFQGYGLSASTRMDQYANKFYILTQPEGIFFTPTPIPHELLEYYASLQLPVAPPYFPGSITMYTAARKLFGDTFSGFAYNQKFNYEETKNFAVFMKRNKKLLITRKGEFGVFPIVANYSGAVDLIIFGRNEEHAYSLKSKLHL